ncbi:MAG: hypothetical protein KKE05_04565 [Nanoarchaeota archaeon]|nr:hypothetical protein [Nanoarchaeota archaeon]
MTIKQNLKDNKLISGLLLLLFGLLMSWGVWVTNGIYTKSMAMEMDKRTVQSIMETQNKTLQINIFDIAELKQEDKRLREKINENQEKIMMLLLDIQKRVR